ncbi:MAG: alpha/beta hydrolase family protein [Solirubrobacteraceae bacterium]
MQLGRRLTTIGVLLACGCGLAGCGGGGQTVHQPRPLNYRPGVALHANVTDIRRDGSLVVETLSYSSVDGHRVPAVFAVPTALEPRGCVIYQGGAGQTKEESPGPAVWRGLGTIGLATFTIEPRETGLSQVLAALKTPETLRAFALDAVVDLRVGLDWLERQRACHHNIAYMGTSFGGVIGVLLAGQDPRIKAAVLTSIGPTFKEAMLVTAQAAKGSPDYPFVQVPGAATDPQLLARAVDILGPYDPDKWIGRIAPRPVMLIEGRFDPNVPPIDALELAAAARDPKTVLYFNGGHEPFEPGPDLQMVLVRVAEFLARSLHLPTSF